MRFLITLDLANDEIWKSGKILKFLVPVKIWIKIDISDYSGPWKAEIWQNADILSQVENLAQNWHFWPLGLQWWNLAKSRNFQSRFKFGSKLTFLTTLDMGRMKFGKIQKVLKIWQNWEPLGLYQGWNLAKSWHFSHVENLAQNWHFWPLRTWEGWSLADQLQWKFALNWEFDHSGSSKDEILTKSRQKKFWFVLKIWLKTDLWRIFDLEIESLTRPAKDLCWKFGSKMQNLQRRNFQKFSIALKIWLEIESLTTPDLPRMKFCKIKKFWFVSKTSSKLTFLTTHNMQRMKFGTIQKFSVASNIWLKIETFDHSGPAKDEIWQHPEIWSRVENLAQNWHFWEGPAEDEIWQNPDIFSRVKNLDQNWHFWPLRTWEGWNFAKFRNFHSQWKFGSNWELHHLGPGKDEIWLNPEILSCLENLAQN